MATVRLPRPTVGVRECLALVAGLFFPLGFAPFYLWPLVFVSLGTLFHVWRNAPPAVCAWRGFLFGVGAFGAGVHWVYVSLSTFGGMPPVLAVVMVIGFVIWLSFFTALAGAAQAVLCLSPGRSRTGLWQILIVMPGVWVFFEWLRGFGSLGFSWLTVGYSQTESTLAGFAPLAGNFAVSFVVCLCASAAVTVVTVRNRVVQSVAVMCVALLFAGGYLLKGLTFTEDAGAPLRVAAVQGNIPLADKWATGAPEALLKHYRQLTEPVSDADIVIWPESAIPEFIDRIDESVWQQLTDDAPDYVIGVLERRFVDKALLYHNAVIALGDERSVYRKQHLVPFGEYLPLRPVFAWVLDYLNIPMSDFIPWQGAQALPRLAGHSVGVSVCYEDAFARDILPALPEAALLVNVSEDAWFGDSLGPHQRLQMARMRSIEAARPMVRASNTGVTAAIERDGSIVESMAQFTAGAIVAQVQPVTGSTPFVRVGNTMVITLILILLTISGIALRSLPQKSA